MLTKDTQERVLQQYPMLLTLPGAVLSTLIADAQLLNLPVGALVFDDNQQCHGFPMILSGCVRVVKSSAQGRELQLYRIRPGESCILSSSCLLGNTRYQARGIAEQAVEMIVLSPQSFHQLLANYASFREYVFNLFTERLTDLMQLVSAVAFQKLDQRLATLLVSKPNPLNTTHQAIADELGCAREIVSRLLKGFSDQGWVKLAREQIILADRAALENFSRL
jgi:CRP/FNR family transcriptional regulator